MKTITELAIILCLALFAFMSAEAQQQRQKQPAVRGGTKTAVPRTEYLTGARPRPLPFSDAVRVGHMLYLSGQIGTNSNLVVVPGGIKAETRQTMENIRAILERNGSSLNEVVKCTVMLADINEWGEVNEIYLTYFARDRLPARSALGANGLALGARVEIECWATVK